MVDGAISIHALLTARDATVRFACVHALMQDGVLVTCVCVHPSMSYGVCTCVYLYLYTSHGASFILIEALCLYKVKIHFKQKHCSLYKYKNFQFQKGNRD